MTTPEIVREKLAKLATLGTPDAIAMELEAQGVKGRTGEAHSCAIAQYLGNPAQVDPVNPPEGLVGVTGAYVAVYTGDSRATHPHVAVPEVVGTFIDRFDAREYPALIGPPPEGLGAA